MKEKFLLNIIEYLAQFFTKKIFLSPLPPELWWKD